MLSPEEASEYLATFTASVESESIQRLQSLLHLAGPDEVEYRAALVAKLERVRAVEAESTDPVHRIGRAHEHLDKAESRKAILVKQLDEAQALADNLQDQVISETNKV